MHVNPDDLDVTSNYKVLIGSVVPRPIAWVSTLSTAGVRNLAPVSFFTVVGRKPPRVSLSLQPRTDGMKKDTFTNIKETGQFVVNMATLPNATHVQRSAIEFSPDEDEFDMLEIDSAPSKSVAPPRVRSTPIAFECETFQIFEDPQGMGAIVWGTVVNYYFRDDVYLPSGRIDIGAVQPIGRLAAEYCVVDTVFVPPLDEAYVSAKPATLTRLDSHADEYSPIDTDTWTPAGAVRELPTEE